VDEPAITAYTIITTQANEQITALHVRMVVEYKDLKWLVKENFKDHRFQ